MTMKFLSKTMKTIILLLLLAAPLFAADTGLTFNLDCSVITIKDSKDHPHNAGKLADVLANYPDLRAKITLAVSDTLWEFTNGNGMDHSCRTMFDATSPHLVFSNELKNAVDTVKTRLEVEEAKIKRPL
ncbi:MAG TPA: hypothetical protein VJ733_09985 [Candidatus Binatia bacterium]|nr:hypothetical protein [Candidatus Binatia bacterium]